MTIAIIGGAGFIGTELSHQLQVQSKDFKILDIVPSRDFAQQSVIVDVRDENAVIEHTKGCDVIYHLAAEHRDDVSPIQLYYDVNVGGAKNVVAAAKANNIKTIIFTSSVAVYPLEPEDPLSGSNETHMPAPFNDYGQSKLDSEKVFEEWAVQGDENSLVMVRLVATFGVGNRGNIFTLINQIASGKFIMIGRGDNRKSIAYVKNVAGFLVHCLSMGMGAHVYNYADKPDLTMRDFVAQVRRSLGYDGMGIRLPYLIGLAGGYCFDVLAKMTGRKFPISSIRVKKFCANTIVNGNKAIESEYKAPYSLEAGLQEMIETEFSKHGKV